MNAAPVGIPDEEPERPVVLVVEDEILVRLVIADELRRQGLRVIEAINGNEALEVLRLGRVDLLMTDVRMPGSVDGLQLARIARATWPELRIVVVSGHAAEPLFGGLADAFFAKPYDIGHVIARIRDLLDSTET